VQRANCYLMWLCVLIQCQSDFVARTTAPPGRLARYKMASPGFKQ
jgi:hypothetical protein